MVLHDEEMYHLWGCESCTFMCVSHGPYRPNECPDCDGTAFKLIAKTEKYPEYNDIFPQESPNDPKY